MHPFFHHLATTLVTLGMQLMIGTKEILKKENWEVSSIFSPLLDWDVNSIFSPLLWFSYVCVFGFAAMLLLYLILGVKKKETVEFRFGKRGKVPHTFRNSSHYMMSFDYE